MLEHCAAHRCHWYEKLSGGAPDQVPVVLESVLPLVAAPDATGGIEFTGGPCPFAVTTPVCAELPGPPVPKGLVAASRHSVVWRAAAAVSVYVCAVAPAMFEQPFPDASQSCHW